MTEPAPLTLEAAEALQAQILDAQRQNDLFELSRLDVLKTLMHSDDMTALIDALDGIKEGSLSGGLAFVAAQNIKNGLVQAKSDVIQRSQLLDRRLNPIPAVPQVPVIPDPLVIPS